MARAKKGDKVKVHYTGTLDDGSVFDSSRKRDPFQFIIGENQVISGFEDAVIGMNPDETKTVKVAAENAYGPHLEEMVVALERDQFPEDLQPEVGQQLQVRRADDRNLIVRVTDVTETHVTLDANHPLAGEDLMFEIELVEILD